MIPTVRWSLPVMVAAVVLFAGASAWAQSPAAPPTPIAPAATAVPEGSGGVAGVIAVVAGLIVLVAIGVKLFDLRRKREAEAVHLQAQVSDALLRDRALFGTPVTPTAHVPFWTGSPAMLELTGQVPSPVLRDAVLRIARDEAARIRPDVQIVDRMSVASGIGVRVA